jgi:sugar O-acyltransferase (sialic acid O-acetyltransferase NeuD family)
MPKNRKLIIVGDSAFAEIAFEYFTHDSDYEVVAFSVERDYLRRNQLLGLPVVGFEDLEALYPPGQYFVFCAIAITQGNRLRTRLYREAKAKGYAPASYLSSRACVLATSEIGEHCFICEATVIQPRAQIGDNVILWSDNFIGHHARIKSNCFALPSVVISEYADIGENSILGPNATVLNNVVVARNSLVEAGALVSEHIPGADKS